MTRCNFSDVVKQDGPAAELAFEISAEITFFEKLIEEGRALESPIEASVIKKSKKKIGNQMKYTNDLMESFREEFKENAWRHPKEHDLQISGDLKAKWDQLEEELERLLEKK